MFRQQRCHCLQIVKRRDQCLVYDTVGDSGAVGYGLGEIHFNFRGKAHLRLGTHPVIATLEFQNAVLACICARKAHCIHIRLAARGHEPDLFNTGHGLADLFGKFNAAGIVGKKSHSQRQLFQHRFKHFRMPMSNQHRAGTDQVIDIFVAVFIPDMAAFAAGNDHTMVKISKTAGRQNFFCDSRPLVLGMYAIHYVIPSQIQLFSTTFCTIPLCTGCCVDHRHT